MREGAYGAHLLVIDGGELYLIFNVIWPQEYLHRCMSSHLILSHPIVSSSMYCGCPATFLIALCLLQEFSSLFHQWHTWGHENFCKANKDPSFLSKTLLHLPQGSWGYLPSMMCMRSLLVRSTAVHTLVTLPWTHSFLA